MEFKQVVGNRRTIRFFDPNRPVEPAKIQVMLEAANRASRAVNADFAKAIVCYRDELTDEVREALKTPTTTVQIDLAPVTIFWYGDATFVNGAQDRLKELVDLGALPVTHGWTHPYVDDLVYPQVLEPLSKDQLATTWAVSVEAGLAIAQAMLAGVDEGLGVGLHAFNAAGAKDVLKVPDHWVPMWILLVGYPAEDPKGVRKKATGERFLSVKRREAINGWLDEFAAEQGWTGKQAVVNANVVRSFLIHNGVLIQGRVWRG